MFGDVKRARKKKRWGTTCKSIWKRRKSQREREGHWGWTREIDTQGPVERADRWQHSDTTKATSAPLRNKKRAAAGEVAGWEGRRDGGGRRRERGGAGLKRIDVREWDRHQRDRALGTCWQGGRGSRGQAEHNCGQNKDLSSPRGQEKYSKHKRAKWTQREATHIHFKQR